MFFDTAEHLSPVLEKGKTGVSCFREGKDKEYI